MRSRYIILIILTTVAIAIGAILTAMAFSETGITDRSSDVPPINVTSPAVNASPGATVPPAPAAPANVGDKTSLTTEEVLDAFGPAPAPLPDTVTTTGLLKYGSEIFPYPNGSMAYYTDYAAAKNTTKRQLIAFLVTDDTYTHDFIEGKFVCVNFAVMLHDHAEARGISARIASVIFSSGPASDSGHMVTAFDTTDAGWVFVDATEGGWVIIGPLKSGDSFGGTRMKYQDGEWSLFKSDTGNVVEKVEII